MKQKSTDITEIKHRNHKIRGVMWGVLLIVLATLITFLVILSQKPKEKVNVKTPTIALVNEDSSSKFNQQDYNFGKNFIDLVSNDNHYNWQVVSRSVADKSYTDGTIDAVIYLPQTLSKDLLTLQDIDPTRAEIVYKISPQSDEVSNKVIQDKLKTVLYEFNQNIVKMYYSSVAGNIAEAENQMGQTVDKQEVLVSSLSNQVQTPFKSSMSNYDTFISGATSLKGINQANVTAQNSFTDSTKNIMKQSSETFSGQLPQINTFFDTQKKITDMNVNNANKGITSQATSDQLFYHNQFDGLNSVVTNNLIKFSDPVNETGQLPDLTNKVADYNTVITSVKDEVSSQRTTLTNKRNDLLSLENDLYSQFLAQSVNVTVDDFTSHTDLQNIANARTALAAKVQTSFAKADNLTNSGYLTKLKASISSMSLVASDYKLDDLKNNGTINQATKEKYERELQVIRQYANAFNLASGGLTLENAPVSNVTNQTMTKNLQLTVPVGSVYESSALPAGVSVTPTTTTGFTLNGDNSVRLVNPVPSNTDGPVNAGSPKTFDIQITVPLGKNKSYSLPISWTDKTLNTLVSNTTDTFALVPQESTSDYDQYVEANFQALADLLGKIDSTSSMLTTLYAGPNMDYTSLLSATNTSDFETANAGSIFNMYGNMDLSQRADRLSDEDVQTFLTIGQTNINKVIQTIGDLNSTITALDDKVSVLQNNLPNTYFEETMQNLKYWYTKATDEIKRNYDSWHPQDPVTLAVKDWQNYNSNETALYTQSGDALYEQIQTLVTTSGKSMASISEAAMAVKDNTPEFDALVSQVSTTQKDAQTVLVNTNNLVTTGNQGVDDSKGFFGSFSKTLANTRTKGIDNQKIYNFFAAPIMPKNESVRQTKVQDTKKAFDIRWLLVFGIGLIAGILAVVLGQFWGKRNKQVV